jgi:hypothetical protein
VNILFPRTQTNTYRLMQINTRMAFSFFLFILGKKGIIEKSNSSYKKMDAMENKELRTFLLHTRGTGLVFPLAVLLHFNNSLPCEWPNDLKCAASQYSLNIVSVFMCVILIKKSMCVYVCTLVCSGGSRNSFY